MSIPYVFRLWSRPPSQENLLRNLWLLDCARFLISNTIFRTFLFYKPYLLQLHLHPAWSTLQDFSPPPQHHATSLDYKSYFSQPFTPILFKSSSITINRLFFDFLVAFSCRFPLHYCLDYVFIIFRQTTVWERLM